MGELKYSTIDGKDDESYYVGEFKASQSFKAQSGRFVVYDQSDTVWQAIATSATQITGFVNEVLTTSATADATKLPIRQVGGRVFEVPYATSGAAATLTEAVATALVGKGVDTYVASGIQYANCSSTSQAILVIVGYNVAKNTVYVRVKDALNCAQS